MQAAIFLPSARSAPESPAHATQTLLARECARILGREHGIHAGRGGVIVEGDETDVMRLNLWSRLAQRVLWPVACGPYATEDDLYRIARDVRWRDWIEPDQTLRVDTTAQRSPLRSLNFATLRVKDAVCDQLREATGQRPSVDTRDPHLSLTLHLTSTHATLYVDTSGDALFKRGWRDKRALARTADGAGDEDDNDDDQDWRAPGPRRVPHLDVHGDAPLKETLAAQMIAVSGWDARSPLLDPCCGAGTIVIEAAQVACGMAPGLKRRFAFERLKPWHAKRSAWAAMTQAARAGVHAPSAPIHGSDVSPQAVSVARANAERAGVAHAIQFMQADALQRPPPAGAETTTATVNVAPLIITNPPFGLRIDAQGAAEGDNTAFAQALAANWKAQYSGWTAWVLSPDPDFETNLRLKARARVPIWNGPLECRLLKIELVSGAMRRGAAAKDGAVDPRGDDKGQGKAAP